MANNLDGLSDIIGQLFKDPSAKEKLNQVIDALSNGDGFSVENSNGEQIINPETGDNGLNLPSNDIINNAISALTKMNTKSDPRINLLESLRPYIRPTRAGKIDLAIRVMQFTKIAPLFGFNIFGNSNNNE